MGKRKRGGKQQVELCRIEKKRQCLEQENRKSADATTEDDSFIMPCKKMKSIRGLPVDVPFVLRFSSTTSEFKLVSATYILVEHASLFLNSTVPPVEIDAEDATKEKVFDSNNTQEQEIKITHSQKENETLAGTKDENLMSSTDSVKCQHDKSTVVDTIAELEHVKHEALVTSIIDDIIDAALDQSDTRTLSASGRTNNKKSKRKSQNVEQTSHTLPPKIVLVGNNTGEERRSSRIQSKGYRPDYSAFDENLPDIENDLNAYDADATNGCNEDWVLDMGIVHEKGNMSMETQTESCFLDSSDEDDFIENQIKCQHSDHKLSKLSTTKASKKENRKKLESESEYKYTNGDNISKTKNDSKTRHEKNETNMISEPRKDDISKMVDKNDKLPGTKNDNNTKKREKDEDPDFDPGIFYDEGSDIGSIDSESSNSDMDLDSDFEPYMPKYNFSKKKSGKKRITVKLQEHKGKYYEEEMESTSMQDRGKRKEEKSQKYLVCALCKNYWTIHESALESHIEIHLNGDFDCKQCEAKFQSVYDLAKHKNLTHKEIDPYKCIVCLIKTGSFSSLQNHLILAHEEKPSMCRYCYKKGTVASFENKTELKQHYEESHLDKLIKCLKCNTYKQRARFTDHKCGGDERTPCDICGKVLLTSSLHVHVKKVHGKERNHKCDHCDYAAANSTKLRSHVMSIHKSKSELGELLKRCEHCDFSCVQSTQLQSHMRTHTGEKPYKCDQCAYAAAWNVQLKDHKKLHGLPFCVTCDQCGVLMKEKMLKIHKKKEHPEKS